MPTGRLGCGKNFTDRRSSILPSPPVRIVLVALTGRAAKRLAELNGPPAYTISCGPDWQLDLVTSNSGVVPGRSVKEDHVEAPRGSSERHEGEDDDGAYPLPGDDERGVQADREAVPNAREARADAREAAHAARKERARHILADAQERDDQAEARDDVAMTRDTAAGLDSFLHDGEHEYGPALKARRSAALDRTDSKADRNSAAADRSKLTQEDSTAPEAGNG